MTLIPPNGAVMHQKGLVHGQGFYQSIHAKTHQRRSPKSDVQSTKHHPTKELRHWCISKHNIKTPANQHKHGLSWFIPSLLSNPSSNSISNSYAATTTGFKQKGQTTSSQPETPGTKWNVPEEYCPRRRQKGLECSRQDLTLLELSGRMWNFLEPAGSYWKFPWYPNKVY